MMMLRLAKYLAVILGALIVVVAAWAGYMYVAHILYDGSVEEVSFQSSDDITMRGWFVAPNKPGRHHAPRIWTTEQ